MYTTEYLTELVNDQQRRFFARPPGLQRSLPIERFQEDGFATIISGVRRCGKSTLMLQHALERLEDALFFNFEDIRLSGFEPDDFVRLSRVFDALGRRHLYLDEVQMVSGWEGFVRQKLDDGYSVMVTGSNAAMLSRELGTKLTGRHLQAELFPFSYSEYCKFLSQSARAETTQTYLTEGGFPEFLRTHNSAIIHQLIDDVLYRDIAVRHGIRDVSTLRQLAGYVFANATRLISASNLAKQLPLKATSTVLEYLSHLESAYLIGLVPKFSYSEKTRIRNPRKAYVTDQALITYGSLTTAQDLGRRLENLIYTHLRRSTKDIFYFNEQHECDFIVFNQGKILNIIQVCYSLNEENLQRELAGALDALNFFNHNEAIIVTLDQSERFTRDGKTIQVLPAHEFMSEHA